MAEQGMMFTQHYSGSTVCAPSRCSLMTGLHTGHCYVRGNKGTNGYDLHIPDETFTVAELFKQSGYATGCIGKWGLGGPDTSGHPNNQGFDYFFGYLGQGKAHYYYPNFLWENTQQLVLNGSEYSHDLMTEKALGFIQQNKDEPFFLYMPYTIPHAEIVVPDDEIIRFNGIQEDHIYSMEINMDVRIADGEILAIQGAIKRYTNPVCPAAIPLVQAIRYGKAAILAKKRNS